METHQRFLKSLGPLKLGSSDRALAVLWIASQDDHNVALSVSEINAALTNAGYPQQNTTRLRRMLAGDRRTTTIQSRFRIRIDAREQLDEIFSPISRVRRIPHSDSVVPAALFEATRTYISKVVSQLNASYDASLFDCCAVMCRRLVETLIIEVYESNGRSNVIKTESGDYLMLSGLVRAAERDDWLTLSRNGVQGLKEFKRLGDLSAHNRRYNAQKSDIDKVRGGLRVACEELLSVARLN